MRGGVGFGCYGAVGAGVEGSVVADRLFLNLGGGLMESSGLSGEMVLS